MAEKSYIYFYNFNNYYNRIIEKFDTLEDYEPYLVYFEQRQVSFNPNDGIFTEHIMNTIPTQTGALPDYCIITDADNNKIVSRWYVIECQRVRVNQYKVTLKRDVIADNYELIMNSKMFIEKGFVGPDDPAIFNTEDMTFNQIKTSETMLKDKSECAWIVGYYDRSKANDIKGTVASNVLDEVYDEYLQTPIDDWKFFQYSNLAPKQGYFKGYPSILDKVTYIRVSSPFGAQNYAIYIYGNGADGIVANESGKNPLSMPITTNAYNIFEKMKLNYKAYGERLTSEIISFYGMTSQIDEEELLSYQGKVIKDSQGRFFRVSIVSQNDFVDVKPVTPGSLFNTMLNLATNNTGLSGSGGDGTFKIQSRQKQYSLELEELFNLSTSYDFTGDKLETTDTPYNIFAIPYGDIQVNYSETEQRLYTSKQVGLETAMSIQQQHPGIVYDIQLLPYCPIQSLIVDNGLLKCTNKNQYSLVKSGSAVNGIIFNVPTAKFTFNIMLKKPLEVTETKIQALCDMHRLCSPNWDGIFEFNVAKNGGVRYINVDCTYKPYTPYIHLNPDFGRLYGRDYDDARGLICGGDFSLPRTTDQWQQYMLNNKNYKESFDRQITNIEVNNNIERVREKFGVAAGAIGAGVAGAIAGGTVGPIGAGIGAGVAGVTSLAGGIADIALNEQARAEAIDYTKDQFGYNLGNIQALPTTLNKVSAYNNNNKLFPVLEYYTCTEIEKQALRDKILFNGMTIMRIGVLQNFVRSGYYVKGKLIIINSELLGDDSHTAEMIAEELNKGVRFL